ncbi:hypothetical protein B0H13DRAFT_1870283 [Mycena leptocephala]|nr:hypothetical protein B0H13DRAFT_1870283 [Mycena leptocephala]
MTTVLITFWAIPISEGLPKRTAVELVPTHLRPLHRCSTDRAIDLSVQIFLFLPSGCRSLTNFLPQQQQTALKFDAAGFGGRFGRMPVRLNLIAAVFASFVGAIPTVHVECAMCFFLLSPNPLQQIRETLYAAQMTRNILWDDERNLRLIGLFSPSSVDEHAALLFLSARQPHARRSGSTRSRYGSFPAQWFMFRFLLIALRTLLNPSFMLSIPAFITHIPGRGAILELITYPPPPLPDALSYRASNLYTFGLMSGLGNIDPGRLRYTPEPMESCITSEFG